MTSRSYHSLKKKQGFLHREHRSKKGRHKNRPNKVLSQKKQRLTEGKRSRQQLLKRAHVLIEKTR